MVFLQISSVIISKMVKNKKVHILSNKIEAIKSAENYSPRYTRHSRVAPSYDLHKRAGGLPLLALAAPNVRHTSKRRREVCNPDRKSNIPIK